MVIVFLLFLCTHMFSWMRLFLNNNSLNFKKTLYSFTKILPILFFLSLYLKDWIFIHMP